MDDGEKVIVITPETKNQDGSQTFFILDPCPSEDCVDDPPSIELIDLTEEYQLENTGAIAVVSTSSTGALEITLTKKRDPVKIEEMDMSENQVDSEKNRITVDLATCKNNSPVREIITDDDINRPIKDEDEDIDVEEISIHDVSFESGGKDQKSEPESVDLDSSEVGEENNQNLNYQDDEVDDGTLFIDDAKYTELREELTQDNLQNLNSFKCSVMKQIEGNGDENVVNRVKESETVEESTSSDVEVVEIVNVKNKDNESICLSFDIVSGPTQKKTLNKHPEAFVHGQLMEIPVDKEHFASKSPNHEFSESTNTALTLLKLAESTGTSCSEMKKVVENQSDVQKLVPVGSSCEPERPCTEPNLATLQPVQFDPPVAPVTPIAETVTSKSSVADPPPKTKQNVPIQKSPVIRMTPEELMQRLKDSDAPRQLLGKEGLRRGQREALYLGPLVTHADIANEFLERQLQKSPYTEPSGGDVIFAMKLAHRLATKIVPPEKPASPSEEVISETPTNDVKVDTTLQNNISEPRNDSDAKTNIENDKVPSKNYALSDKIELLKILEDDPDDVSTSDSSQIILEQKTKAERKKIRPVPLIKMHPELERELALKQLQDFNKSGRKKKVSFIPDSLKKIRLEKNHEHNNNLNSVKNETNGTKKRVGELLRKPYKKLKKEAAESVTADPSQITETLTVEGQNLIDDTSIKDGKSVKQYSNKRFSRSSETPPRELPMDIILNGMEDLPKTNTLSKNKIFKATNPRKRKEELKEKRQKNFVNVFQRNKPQKKRGRPPKKKQYPTDDMLNKEFLLKASMESNDYKNGIGENYQKNSNSETLTLKKEVKPIKTKKMREIERLLGDEGAINMLYSVEQKRASGCEPKRGMLPSYRRKKKDLILKTKLVKSAVLRLTTNPIPTSGRISLRGQAPKDGESEESDKSSLRKMSVDSHDSHHSHHSLSSPPPEIFLFPAKIVPAEASRIIRRHSSSSNYSSRSNSPRRLSVDSALSPEAKITEGDKVTTSSVVSNKKNNQSKTPPQQIHSESSKNFSEKTDRLLIEKCKKFINKEHTPQTDPKLDLKKISTSVKSKSKQFLRSASPLRRGRQRKIFSSEDSKKRKELSTSLAAALEDFTKENKSGGKNIPIDTPKKMTVPTTPSSKTSTKAVYRRSVDPSRAKAAKPSVVFKELTLKRHDRVAEISLTPISTTLQNALNVNVLRELVSVMTGLSKDDNCHVVLITSQGAVFCQGVDFPSLVHPSHEQRTTAALEMAVAIKEFVKCITMLARPVVAAVHAPAVGLGVTLLPLCDMVLVAESATFHTPYARLGHIPEGAATLTLPSLLGPSMTSELLFACRKFSASEALQGGLITRILPSENFHQEVLSIVKSMASQSSQAMNATKVLLRHGLVTGLETTLVSETHLLIQHWATAECQSTFASALDKEAAWIRAPTPSSSQSRTEVGPK